LGRKESLRVVHFRYAAFYRMADLMVIRPILALDLHSVFEDNIGASYQSEDMASIATRKVVIITGGNAGIGLETAKHLSKIGFHTIIGIIGRSLSHQSRM
jgi:hypothetical protein